MISTRGRRGRGGAAVPGAWNELVMLLGHSSRKACGVMGRVGPALDGSVVRLPPKYSAASDWVTAASLRPVAVVSDAMVWGPVDSAEITSRCSSRTRRCGTDGILRQ